jgi:hypothetical protein
MKTRAFLIFVVGIGLMFGAHAFPQATPYPPTSGGSQSTSSGKITQSKNTPTKPAANKMQTAKAAMPRTQSKSHQAKKERSHGGSHGGVEVGIGATIDLGGIGQRRAEPDPFAVPAERQPVIARTEEKPKTPKKPREVAKTDPFAGVQLTGERAKEQSNPR